MNNDMLCALAEITDEERKFLAGEEKIDRDIYMAEEGNVISVNKMLPHGDLVAVRTHSRFVDFPEHTHDYIEVVYMCSGKTTHVINGKTVVLKEGELLFLSPNARQRIYPAGEGDIAVNLITRPQFYDGALAMMTDEQTPLKKFIVDSLAGSDTGAPYLLFEVSDILPIQNLMENLIWGIFNKVKDVRKINSTTMGLLFLQLLNHTDRLSYTSDEEELVLKTLMYIDGHYADGSLTELSRLLHYDYAWLSREIKERTGKTYTEHVQSRRLSKAAYLLKNTDIGVDSIAEQVGYENVSYFHRIFKSSFGITPYKYKKAAMTQNEPLPAE